MCAARIASHRYAYCIIAPRGGYRYNRNSASVAAAAAAAAVIPILQPMVIKSETQFFTKVTKIREGSQKKKKKEAKNCAKRIEEEETTNSP